MSVDEVDSSLEELGSFAGLGLDELRLRLRKHTPVLGPKITPVSINERSRGRSRGRRRGLAWRLACSWLLSSTCAPFAARWPSNTYRTPIGSYWSRAGTSEGDYDEESRRSPPSRAPRTPWRVF